MTDLNDSDMELLYDDFDEMAEQVRIWGERMLESHIGSRCQDFCDSCVCCQRWKALDDLTRNPYVD